MRRIFLYLLVFMTLVAAGQPPARFYATYGGEGDDVGYSAKVTKDSMYVIAGSTSSYGNMNTNAYLAKIDKVGNPLWYKHFGGKGIDIIKAVVQLPDSGYAMAGFTNSYGAGGFDVYLIRVDKIGNEVWQKTWGGTDWDFASDIILAADHSIMVVGYTESFGSGKRDGIVLKFDLGGNLIKQKMIGYAENDELNSIIETNDNLVAVVGYSTKMGQTNGDGYFAKLDLNCDTIFTRTFGGLGRDFATDLVQRLDNEFVVCGGKTYSDKTYIQSVMISYDATGDSLWENHYNSTGSDEFFFSVANSNHIPLNSAYLRNVPVPAVGMQGNILVAKPEGWSYLVNSFGGTQDEECLSIESTADGGYIITGSTESFASHGKDIFFIKLDSTIVNYSSIVGFSDDQNQQFRTSCYINEKGDLFISFSKAGVKNITVTDLYGRVLEEFSTSLIEVSKNGESLSDGFLLIRIRYTDGSIETVKIINP